ncbi:MAG: hypothetical protein JOZ08_05130 [Verrucomicrobia bacterium]|nr:hypothetical protein [Verrucomicrobiota bacterium]
MLKRLLRITRWFSLVLVCAGLGWLGWYGYTKGLGRHWRSLLEKEFARYGLYIDIGKITLDPFRGLIARDIQIFNNPEEESLLAEINQVSLDINYGNLFQHEPALNSVDLSGATLIVPLNFRSPQSGKVRVTDFHARIYLFPGRIEVRQASAQLYGIRINAAATLIHPQNISTAVAAVANDPDPSDATIKFINTLFHELRRVRYLEPATLSFAFQMDLANPRDWRINDGNLVAADVKKDSAELKDLVAKFSFENQRFSLRSLHATDSRGELFALGTWDTATGEKKFQVRSTLDLAELLRDEPEFDWLREWEFTQAPELELEGAFLRNWEPQIIGKLSLEQFSVRGVSFQGLRAEFSRQGRSWMASNVELTHRTGTVTGEVIDRPGEFRLRLHSALNPKAIVPLLPSTFLSQLSEWDFQAPPVVQLDLVGSGPEIRRLSGDGQCWLGPTRFRGVSMNSGSGAFRLRPFQVSVENVRVSRDEGVATASFVLDLRTKTVAQLEAQAHLQPAAMAAWFEPSLLPLLDHLQFSQAPDLSLKSDEQNGQTEFSMHIDMRSGVIFRCGPLEVPIDSADADLHKNQDKIDLAIPKGRIGQGQCSVIVRQMHPNAVVDSEITFDRVSLLDLKIRSALLAGWEGQLSGWLKSRFDVSDSSRDSAEGKLSLDAADLSKPHFVEPGFKKLVSAGFNRLGQLNAEFVANLGLLKINRLSLASGEHVLDLSGSVDFTSAVTHLSGHLDQDTGVARVTGPITDPDWEVVFPRRD